LDSSIYQRLKEKAFRTAERIGHPSFYTAHDGELEISASSFRENGLLHACRAHIDEAKLHPAHGLPHCEKVAIEAGAIVLAERPGEDAGIEEIMSCAQIAGLLHDITRAGKDHSVTGSIEAGRILELSGIGKKQKRYVTAAIRNHEAFREVLTSEDESARLVSDALYDADKFRWGPDNFTTTLWLMVKASGTSARTLYNTFQEKMTGIRRIKETFRSETGRTYGPEFIDLGIEIGNEIYSEMERMIRD
jgi:hypothetical protein